MNIMFLKKSRTHDRILTKASYLFLLPNLKQKYYLSKNDDKK
jgi:hypothetical protein